MGRVEKLPDFEEVLAWFHPKVEAKPMSNEEVIRSMRQWVVVTGGTLSDPAMAEVAGVGVTTTEVQEPEL